MSEAMETQLAVLKNDIGYIKQFMSTISGDIKEIKGAYVPYSVFIEAKVEAEKIHDNFVTKERFKSTHDKVRFLWNGMWTILSFIILGIVGTVLSSIKK